MICDNCQNDEATSALMYAWAAKIVEYHCEKCKQDNDKADYYYIPLPAKMPSRSKSYRPSTK